MTRVEMVRGRALPLRGDDIDTDRIIPARFLKSITFEGLDDHLFEDDRASMPGHPFADERYAGATVLLVNRNFGCGSSREHAPQAIYRKGFRAVVGESFSEIFFGNSLALGLPCVSVAREDADRLMRAVEEDPDLGFVVDLARLQVRAGALTASIAIPSAAREALLSGQWDATGLLREHPEDVARVASRLPYLRGFDA